VNAQTTDALPSALERMEEIFRRAAGRRPAVFLDYDGTLTPIVSRPEDAVLSPAARQAVKRLSELCPVAVISGRDLADVKRQVGIKSLVYAGSHGFDIAGPHGRHLEYRRGLEYLPLLDRAQEELQRRLRGFAGVQVERKRFAIAVHFRRVAPERVGVLESEVDAVRARHSALRKSGGKMIFELRPGIDWDKGRAVLWLLSQLDLDDSEVLPLYIGDDQTDEDAFRCLTGRGLGIVVRDGARVTAARYALEDVEEVRRFLEAMADQLSSAAQDRARVSG
jgi:trehalose 6-phosphate phosphatase